MNRFFLTIFAIIPILLFAQNIDVTIFSQNDALANPNSHSIVEIDQLATYPFFEENYQIPAYSLYDEYWDTTHIRSKSINIPFSNDRLMLMLVQDANNPFEMPCRFESVKTHYGLTKKGDFHPGVDLQTEPQTLVKSCFDGIVRIANKYGDYGFMIVVRHYNGLETVYAQLGKLCVKSGQIVKAGQVIGQMGAAKNSNFCIFHFETRLLNEHFDPELIIDFEEEDLLQNNIALMSRDFNIIPIDSLNNKQKQPQKNTTSLPENPSKQINTQKNSEESKEEETPEIPQLQKNENPKIESPDAVYHTVKPGENLYRISLKYNTTVEKILQLNNLKNADKIVEGEKLRVK